jgi:GWxTD domain-containing protein
MSTSLITALGLTLAHFLWEGAAIALLLLLFWRAGARRRYAAACAALAAMPVVCLLTFLLVRKAPHAALASRVPVPELNGVPLPDLTTGWSGTPISLWSWVVPLWMAGVAIFYLRSVGGWIAARRLRSVGVRPVPAEWQARFTALCERIGVKRAVVLIESCVAEVPVVIGYLRPVVLLPAGLATGLSTQQVEALLLHELAHIRRHDYLVNLLQNVVEGLLFYHPAVWWVSHLIRTEREHCCDDTVVALRGDARGYAGALAALEEMRTPQAALAASGGSLVKRVRRLLRQPEGPQGSPATTVAALVLLAAAATMLSAWQQGPQMPGRPAAPSPRVIAQVQTKQGEVRSTPRQAVPDPYRKWLNEDVAYIITNEERATLRDLQSDSEREHFIEQFWLRRDPTPGTVENEFKEEHYRRIAYSNENFADTDLPGWKTDRGRVYIVYGPPDEKESHPSATPPNEQWMYKYIEGIGANVIIEFVEQNGRMVMTRDPQGGEEPQPLIVEMEKPLPVSSPSGFYRVTVANGDVADAIAVSPTELRIEGKRPGRTLLTIWQDAGKQKVYRVTVGATYHPGPAQALILGGPFPDRINSAGDLVFRGKSGSQVIVNGRSAAIEIPAAANTSWKLWANVVKGAHALTPIEQMVQSGQVSKQFELAPGTYALDVVRKSADGGFLSSDRVDFAVK